MSLIFDITRDRKDGTPGPWMTPFETFDHGWSLYTDGENSYVGIGAKRPIAITAVESAFGMDHVLGANARRIARVPRMEAALLAAEELADAIARSDPWDQIDRAMSAYRKATGETQ